MSAVQEVLVTRKNIEDLVVKMFVATDERDWPTLQACFTDPFVLDMSSMVGGGPVTRTPEQVASAWEAGFKPLTHVHHQVGNFRTVITGASALVCCYGIALHYRSDLAGDSRTRRFVGTYELDLTSEREQWRISRLQFKLKFIDGNLNLEAAT